MRSAVKIPLTVTPEQAAILDGQSKIANWLYNKLLEVAHALRKQYRATQDKEIGRTLYTERGLRDLIPALKEQYPFLRTIYSSPLKNAALRLSQAIRSYQDGKHGTRKKPVNWPRFRAWKRGWFSLQYDEPWKGYDLTGRTLTLSLGKDAAGKQLKLTLTLAEPLPHWVGYEHIRQCRIVKEGHLYWVVFTVERRLPNGKPLRKVAVLDPNHKNCAYAVGTDGKDDPSLELSRFGRAGYPLANYPQVRYNASRGVTSWYAMGYVAENSRNSHCVLYNKTKRGFLWLVTVHLI